MSIIIFLILILLLTIIVYLEVRKFYINRQLKNFALIKGAPLIGAIDRILRGTNFDMIDLVLKGFDEVKSSTIRFWAGPVLVLGIYDPTSIGIILTHENALNKPFVYEYFYNKKSLFSAVKESWKSKRRALNPAFSASVLQTYLPHCNEKSRILINQMQPYLIEASDFYRSISLCIADMLVRTLFGSNMEHDERFFEIKKEFVNAIQYRIPRIWLRYDFIYHNLFKMGREERCFLKYASDMIKRIYNQKVEEKKLSENTEQSVNNLLERCLELERQGIYSRKDVMDELRMVFVAGVDTPSTAIFGTLLMLAINQRHQELVVDELRSIFESSNCDVTQAHLAAMNYTERVIKESIRLLPPAPFIARRTTDVIDLPNGTVPKHTNILISIIHTHRNQQIWGENVLEFDPDRFLPENIEKRPPFSYIPFSAGPRNCIGMKYSMILVKTVLAHLLRQYKFTTDLKFDEIKIFMQVVLDIVIDKPLQIEERDFLTNIKLDS